MSETPITNEQMESPNESTVPIEFVRLIERKLIAQTRRADDVKAALKESKSRIRLLGETLAEHVSEDFMEARGLDWENWSSNNSVCTAPACGQPNPEPPYGEGGEEKP